MHLLLGTEVVVAVTSSINAVMKGCHMPHLMKGPGHLASADLNTMSIATEKCP